MTDTPILRDLLRSYFMVFLLSINSDSHHNYLKMNFSKFSMSPLLISREKLYSESTLRITTSNPEAATSLVISVDGKTFPPIHTAFIYTKNIIFSKIEESKLLVSYILSCFCV